MTSAQPPTRVGDAVRSAARAEARTSARRRLLLGLSVLAAAQALAWPLAMWSAGMGQIQHPRLASAAWAGSLVAATVGLASAWLGERHTSAGAQRGVWGALGLAAASLLAGGLSTQPYAGAGFAHPSVPLAVGVGILAAIMLPQKHSRLALAALGMAYLGGAYRTVALGPGALSALATNLATIVGLPLLIGWLVEPWLTAAADSVALKRRMQELAAAERAAGGREAERAKQYRTLHDTVLSTLSALSRGSLDPSRPEIRQRLSADADYLRGLISTTESAAGMYLVGEIARITREFAASGLRVHPHISDVPDVLPDAVQVALSGCIQEALTNVVRHSGALEAWVTVVGQQTALGETPRTGEWVEVTITDRGRGFDPAAPRRGLGIAGSIEKRVRSVGGSAVIDSAPDQGTTVELRWPA